MAGIPSLIPDPHPFPLEFLPPENTLPIPPATLKENRQTNGLTLTLKKYGKAAFIRAVRQYAEPTGSKRKFGVSRSILLNRTVRRKAYRYSRESFIRSVMEPVMKSRFWPDKRCAAMAETLQTLKPQMLLDIATGPGGLLCRALPKLRQTTAIGLEIGFDACRIVIAESHYFGFARRIEMVHGDARLLPFPDSIFDCVSGWTALYHISQYEAAVREAKRVLRKGGYFVGTVHTKYPRHCPEDLTREEEEEFISAAHLPSDINSVCSTFREQGFAITKKTKVGNSHLLVARRQ